MVYTRFDLDRTAAGVEGDTVREDLTDIIYNIAPTEVPAQSNFGRGGATATLHEWQIDSLAAAGVNRYGGGADFDDTTSDGSTPIRLGNVLQISRKHRNVSRRADIVDKAGRRSQLAYDIAIAGKELRRDVEFGILQNGGAVIGSAAPASASTNDLATSPRSAGLNSWLSTNGFRGTGGADGALNGGGGTFGVPTTGATDGTATPLLLSRLLNTQREAYDQGGNPNMWMFDTVMKAALSAFLYANASSTGARIATQYQEQGRTPRGGATVQGAVDVFVTDFGVVDIVPNRFQRGRDAFILDTEYFEIVYLDGYKVEEIAKTGDGKKRMLLVDWTLASLNEAASGSVNDIDTASAAAA